MEIRRDRLLETFASLVAVDAPSFGERDMADRLLRELAALGFAVREDDAAPAIGGSAGNVFGTRAGTGTGSMTVLLSAHMDTVDPARGKRAVFRPDGRITSAGDTVLGADDAAGIAVILEALREQEEDGLPCPALEVLFTAAEEAYTAGASAFACETLRSDAAYCLDISAPPGTWSAGEPTLFTYEAGIRGRAAHAGFAPEEGISAVRAAAAAVLAVPQGRVSPTTTCNIGRIEGGIATNIVPELVTLRGEIRSTVHEEAAALLERIRTAFENACGEAGAALTFTSRQHLTAYRVERSDPAVTLYEAAVRAAGLEPQSRPFLGGSDNNVLRKNGVRGLCISAPMYAIHSCEEFTLSDELVKCVEILRRLLTEASSLPALSP